MHLHDKLVEDSNKGMFFQRGELHGWIRCGRFGSNNTATPSRKAGFARRSFEPCLIQRIVNRHCSK